MLLTVAHLTRFDYSSDVFDTSMEMRLRPRNDVGQRCLAYALEVVPYGPIRSFVDMYGNTVETYNHRPPHSQITVRSRSLVSTGEAHPVETAPISAVDRHRFLRFDGPVSDTPALRTLADAFLVDGAPPPATPDLLSRLAALVHSRFAYRPNVTRVDSSIADLLEWGGGVCQDFAHLWLALCRALGIPARYVSGYIWVGENRQELASHAWGEAWVPGCGWQPYDPTNYREATAGRAGDRYVRLAIGRDYRDVPPTRGVFRGAATETLTVDVRVDRIDGDDLVTVQRSFGLTPAVYVNARR